MTIRITRRTALAAAAALPAAFAVPRATRAQSGEAKPLPMGKARGFKLGDLEVTTLLAAMFQRPNPHEIFGLNASEEEFLRVSEENFVDPTVFKGSATPSLVKSGDELVLVDAGPAAGGMIAALAEAGYAPEDVTKIVLTHMHPDHIGGLMTEGSPTFGNAALFAVQSEYDFWTGQDSEAVATNVAPLIDRITFIEDGAEVAPGITAMAAHGHTPGHTAFMLESGGKQLLLAADTANHPVWSIGYPDWEVVFDVDKEMAAATRRKILGMLAAERVPMIGYHMPFPAAGYIETRGDGFRFVPVGYQMIG